MTDPLRQATGLVLRERRKRLGLRLKDVALEMGTTPGWLSSIETGSKHAKWDTLERFADALHWSMPDLLRAVAGELDKMGA